MTVRLQPPLWGAGPACGAAHEDLDLDRSHRRVHVFGQGPHVYHRIDQVTGVEEIHRFPSPADALAAYLAAMTCPSQREP